MPLEFRTNACLKYQIFIYHPLSLESLTIFDRFSLLQGNNDYEPESVFLCILVCVLTVHPLFCTPTPFHEYFYKSLSVHYILTPPHFTQIIRSLQFYAGVKKQSYIEIKKHTQIHCYITNCMRAGNNSRSPF